MSRIETHIRMVLTVVWLITAAMLSGCNRGQPSERPPVHLNPNMDNQKKYLAQEKSEFFADGSTMREPVPGTVARENLRNDDSLYRGMDGAGNFIKSNPLEVNMELLERGQEHFNIYCSPCHSRVGDGKGIMIKRGYVPPPSFHDERLVNMPDGEIFNTITNGLRNMPMYSHQVSVRDRWAIIAYLRALQRSQGATIEDVPEEIRERVKSTGK